MAECSNLGIPVKKRLRFRDEDDMALLREVAGQNPFANTELWEVIKQNVYLLTGKEFSLKTLKDHLDLLIKLWLEKTKILKDKSGIEEEYSEKDQLCQDIYDTMRLFRGKEKRKTPKKKLDFAGKLSRDQWANQFHNEDGTILMEVVVEPELNPIDHDYTSCNTIEKSTETNGQNQEQSKVLRPIRSRKRKANIQKQGLSYLERYDKIQMEIKKQDQLFEERRMELEERKIAIEEKKLELAERKLALDEYEKKKSLEILEQQQQDIRKMIERQDKIIDMLLQNKTFE